MFNGTPLTFRQLWVNGQKAVRARDVANFEKMHRTSSQRPRQRNTLGTLPGSGKHSQSPFCRDGTAPDVVCGHLRIKSIEIHGDSAACAFTTPKVAYSLNTRGHVPW
jgi:hypothetical protein